jgi:hypothetical protein
MTEGELAVIRKALTNLDVALMGKTPKAFMRVLVWQAREEIKKLTETNLGEAKNVQTERE